MSKQNVPELRFPEFSGEWEIDTFNEIFDFYNNKRVPLEKGERKRGPYPYYGATGIIDYIDDYIFEGEYLLIGEDGANIVSRNAKLVYFATGKFWVNNHAHILKPKMGDNYFFYNALERINYVKYNSGTAQPKLNHGTIKKIKVSYPQIEEQNKIGNFLSKLDRLIELEEKKLELLEEQKKGYMQKIFSQELKFKDENGNDYPEWEEKRLLDLAKVKTGNMNVQDSDEKGLYEFFDRSQHIKYLNTFTFDEEAIIYPGEGSEFLPKYFKGKYSLHQRAYSIFNINCNPIFLYYILQTKGNHFLKFAVGSTVKSLRMSSFDKLSLTIPTIEEQGKIERLLSKLERRIAVSREKCNELVSMKKGLLEKLFI